MRTLPLVLFLTLSPTAAPSQSTLTPVQLELIGRTDTSWYPLEVHTRFVISVSLKRAPTKTGSGYENAWIRYDFADVQQKGSVEPYDQILEKVNVRCVAKQTLSLTETRYLKDEVTGEVSELAEWAEWLPESVAENVFERLCERLDFALEKWRDAQ